MNNLHRKQKYLNLLFAQLFQLLLVLILWFIIVGNGRDIWSAKASIITFIVLILVNQGVIIGISIMCITKWKVKDELLIEDKTKFTILNAAIATPFIFPIFITLSQWINSGYKKSLLDEAKFSHISNIAIKILEDPIISQEISSKNTKEFLNSKDLFEMGFIDASEYKGYIISRLMKENILTNERMDEIYLRDTPFLIEILRLL